MAELKTKPTNRSVTAYLASIEDEARREDAKTVLGETAKKIEDIMKG